ncbi:uncharacterized protein LOC125868599 [Solanum stenotomum]|uniref:uncharacterized protein LOC125868599 n=1 Tax=Solanum stenotomum TaxID=172797 RepID=UPI0020D164EA|nr:uncharacterized protein LOC125868599 [Solanum stenotomum]
MELCNGTRAYGYKEKLDMGLKRVFKAFRNTKPYWSQKDIRSNKLKELLTIGLVLTLPVEGEGFTMHSDTSRIGVPQNSIGVDSIWVIINRFTKSTYFLPIQSPFNSKRLARIYIHKVIHLHVVLVSIISDWGTQFTSCFKQNSQDELGTRVDFSTALHPQNDAQLEKFGGQGDIFLPFTLFAYNNNYHSSIQKASFKLHRYVPNESHVLQYDAVELDDYLTFVEEPVAILDIDVR